MPGLVIVQGESNKRVWVNIKKFLEFEDRLAGPLELGPAARGQRVFLPMMLRNYSPWWPQSVHD